MTDRIKETAEFLEAHGFTDLKVREKSIVVHEAPEHSAEINALLVTNGFKVSELTVQNRGFEGYFIKRLGN